MSNQTILKQGVNLLLSEKYLEAREKYTQLFNTKRMAMRDFYGEMTVLIDLCPSFLPPYLEVLENLEGHARSADYKDFLNLTSRVVLAAYTGSTREMRQKIEQMNYFETHALYWLTRRLMENKRSLVGGTFSRLYKIGRLAQVVEEIHIAQIPFSTNTHLRCVKTNIPVRFGVQDLIEKEHYWYEQSARQEAIYNHRDTQTIVLRELVHQGEIPVPVEGMHESKTTKTGDALRSILDLVENFAEEQRGGLGRVAVVRLRPKSVVYRHFDSEKHLIGRTRYHLILACKRGNMLMSGVDFVRVVPGELWLYDNQALHRSINDSNDWRTHVIFDMHTPTTEV